MEGRDRPVDGGAGTMTTRRLVLLTNDFPLDRGDTNFVRHEIEALAASFDEVDIFNYSRHSGDHIALPANARYAGNLYPGNRARTIRALLSPRAIAIMYRAARRESSAGRLRGNRRRFTAAALVGMRVARHPGLESSLRDPAVTATVYAYWGMGAGLSLPWLPRRVAAFVRVHRYDLYEEESGYLPFRRALFERASGILAISEESRRYLLTRYPDAALESKVIVSRLGTEDPGPVRRPGPSASKTIVSCSGVTPVKRVERILDALIERSGTAPVRWVHFGDGPLSDRLRSAVAAAHLPNTEVDLRGAVGNEDVLRFYASERVDLFVNVSASEGVPVSIMEALSFGIPVLATRVGGTPELVDTRLGSGEVIDPDFTDVELAAAIDRILASPDELFSPRRVWEKYCDSRLNSGTVAAILTGRAIPGSGEPG